MTAPSMRRLIDIMEEKLISYDVERYHEPGSSKVVARTVIRARDRADLKAKLRAWMDQQGLDPEDEDDLAHIAYRAK